MKFAFRKRLLASSVITIVAGSIAPAVTAQSSELAMLEEVVVTARRRDESLQDVPLTVNAVSAEQIENLNIRHFEDLQGVVPGLTLSEDSLAPNASMRGVKYDTFASGNNATVEFYLNDAPYTSTSVLQAMFDVGQIEVLHGPQGTLRGRASPSGSITITTIEPSLEEVEGYIDATATDTNATNLKAAVSVPIIENMLGVRVAGFIEENDMYEVDNLRGEESSYEGDGYRLSALFRPTDFFTAKAYYQKFEPEREPVYQVESAYRADSSKAPPAFSPDIKASDRKGTSFKESNKQEHERWGIDLSYEFAGQALKYVYSESEFSIARTTADESGDVTGAFLGTNNQALIDAWYPVGQAMTTTQESESHELRLQSVEPLFGFMDYVVGAFKLDNIPDTSLRNPSFVEDLDSGAFLVPIQNIRSVNKTFEESYYGNLTFRITEATEFSVGGRYIEYEEDRLLDVGVIIIGPGSVLGNDGQTTNYADIYSASLKHHFTDNLMAYINFGTSWRGPAASIGDFSAVKSPNQLEFADTAPEESESFEIGVRSTWLDDKLRLNGTIFQQSFEDYVYRAPGDGVFYNSYNPVRDNMGNVIGVAPSVGQHNFISGVPIDVYGIEFEAFYLASANFEVGFLFSYSKGEIENGKIPCNDLDGNGVPDATITGAPTVADVEAVNGGNFFLGGENVSSCNVDFRANDAPLWNATVTSEYSFPLAGWDAYVRGLWTFYGSSENDPINPYDDVDSYNILNAYFGLRDPEGRWEAKLYAKNLLDTEEVLEREQFPGAVSYSQVSGGATVNVVSLNSEYRQVEITKPREIGINLRYNF